MQQLSLSGIHPDILYPLPVLKQITRWEAVFAPQGTG